MVFLFHHRIEAQLFSCVSGGVGAVITPSNYCAQLMYPDVFVRGTEYLVSKAPSTWCCVSVIFRRVWFICLSASFGVVQIVSSKQFYYNCI